MTTTVVARSHADSALADTMALQKMGILTSLQIVQVRGGPAGQIWASMLRAADRAQPPSQRNRLSQFWSPVLLPDSGKDLQLRPDQLSPWIPVLKMLGLADYSPLMLVTIQNSKRGSDGALVFLADVAPRFSRRAPDAFVIGSQGHISYVVPGLCDTLLAGLDDLADWENSTLHQCAWLLARLQVSYTCMLDEYQGDLSRFVLDLSRFAQAILQESVDGSGLISWDLVSGAAIYLDCEVADPLYARTAQWVLDTRKTLLQEDLPVVLFWVLGDFASPSVKDLLRISPSLSFLRTAQLDDPQPLEPQPERQAARYVDLLATNDLSAASLTAIKAALLAPAPPKNSLSRDQRSRLYTRGRQLGLVFEQPRSVQEAAAVGLRSISAADRSDLVQHFQGLPGARFLFEALPEDS